MAIQIFSFCYSFAALQRSLGDQRADLFGVPQNMIFPGAAFISTIAVASLSTITIGHWRQAARAERITAADARSCQLEPGLLVAIAWTRGPHDNSHLLLCTHPLFCLKD
jgi:hypothetical protein